MATRAQATVVEFQAWDTVANVAKTGDSANFTMRWVKDGVSAAVTAPAVTEIDATNAPGLYKISLSATETDCLFGALAGRSVTAGVSIMPVRIAFTQIPLAAPNVSGGLPTVGTGAGQIQPDGAGAVPVSKLNATATNIKKNVAGQGPMPLLMLDSTNHNPAPGKTVTATIDKDGAGFNAVGGSIAETANGVYWYSPSQADTNCRVAVVRFTATACDDSFEFIVTDP